MLVRDVTKSWDAAPTIQIYMMRTSRLAQPSPLATEASPTTVTNASYAS